jgi:hypothetical protein
MCGICLTAFSVAMVRFAQIKSITNK